MSTTPVLASSANTRAPEESGATTPGGLTTWLVTNDGDDPAATPTAQQTGWVELGDASWVSPMGNHLAVLGEHDHHLWVMSPGLRIVSECDLGGGQPCHCAIDPTGRLLAVAHYESGEVSVVQVDQWGTDPQIIARTHVEGEGPVAGRQDSAHPHHILWLDRTHFAVTDLGADAVRFLRLSGLGMEQIGELAAPAGLGPRHALLTRDRSKQILTVSGELSASVQSWSRRASEDAWSRGWRLVDQTPSSSDATAMPSAIVPGPESQLLVANRGVGTCGVLSGPLGHHKLIDEFSLGGVQPRDVTSDGDQLWVAEQADGAVLCLHRSSEGWRQRLRLDLPGASRVLIGPTLG